MVNIFFVDVPAYSLASEVSCKRVAARVLNKILGQHPKVTRTRTRTTAHAPPHTHTTHTQPFSWCAVGGLLAAVGGQVAAQAIPLHPLARGARCMFILIISYFFLFLSFCLFLLFIILSFCFVIFLLFVMFFFLIWLFDGMHSSSAGDVRHQDRHLPAHRGGHSDDPKHDAPHVRRLQRHLPRTNTWPCRVCVVCVCVCVVSFRRRSLTRNVRGCRTSPR